MRYQHPSGVNVETLTEGMESAYRFAFEDLFSCGKTPARRRIDDLFSARNVLERRKADNELDRNPLLRWWQNWQINGYEPDSVWLEEFLAAENRYSGYMAATQRYIWMSARYPRSTVFLKEALYRIEKMIEIERNRTEPLA